MNTQDTFLRPFWPLLYRCNNLQLFIATSLEICDDDKAALRAKGRREGRAEGQQEGTGDVILMVWMHERLFSLHRGKGQVEGKGDLIMMV